MAASALLKLDLIKQIDITPVTTATSTAAATTPAIKFVVSVPVAQSAVAQAVPVPK